MSGGMEDGAREDPDLARLLGAPAMPGLVEFDMYLDAMPRDQLQIAYRALALHCFNERLRGIRELRETLPRPSQAETSLFFIQEPT